MSDAHIELPAIPAKRYFTIGEVSELCGVKPYVLRYWEQEFTQLRPMKRRGNRRYYQHHEVLLIRRIRELLYDQGFTISGARNRLIEGDSGVRRPRTMWWCSTTLMCESRGGGRAHGRPGQPPRHRRTQRAPAAAGQPQPGPAARRTSIDSRIAFHLTIFGIYF
jgi:DNA-binding transcriptional MerR regulator